MYIEDKYWGNYIGGTDDSLTLIEYLASKQKQDISMTDIFEDMGLKQLPEDLRQADSLSVNVDEMEMEIYYPIDLITDLAAILLECKVSGSIELSELADDDEYKQKICITATPEEHAFIHEILRDFVAAPLAYNLSEMVPEEDMLEMAAICEELRKELYE